MKNKKIIIALFIAVVSAVYANLNFAFAQQNKTQYRVIENISQLLEKTPENKLKNEWLNEVDLSSLDLRNYEHLFVGEVGYDDENAITQWSDKVIWPGASKMPSSFNPQKLLEQSKKPEGVAGLHSKGITGKGINIAIIDQRLLKEHPEYKNRIKYYEVFGNNWKHDGVDYHGSLVAGIAVGQNTGTAPGADVYYFAANNWPDYTMHTINKVLRRIIDINKTLPENEKIRFLSCSWGGPDDKFADEREKLFKEAEQNGIMVLGGFYKHTMDNNTFDKRYGMDGGGLGIPTDGKTNPYYTGGYAFDRLGGTSSTFPYLAGVFAMALQDNQIFTQLPDWQDQLMEIAHDTAINSVVNPAGIVAEVTRISKTLE